MKIKLAVTTFSFALLISCCASSSVLPDPEHHTYTLWLNSLKSEMLKRGISQQTLDKAYAQTDYYHPAPEVVKIDRRQAEFILTSPEYLNRMVHTLRIKKGRENYLKLYPLFQKIQKRYGVQPEYLVAFWGAETNYGVNYGTYPVIGALTQLSYDPRRAKFFREQLYHALKIVDASQIEPE